MSTRGGATLFAYCWLGVCALIVLLPIAWMLFQSFKEPIDVIAVPPKFIFTPTLDNYAAVISSPGFRSAFLGSLIIATASVLIGLVATGTVRTAARAVQVGVVPFVFMDLIKAALAVVIADRVRSAAPVLRAARDR